MGFSAKTFDAFTRAYVTCALWSSMDDDGTPLDKAHDWTDIDGETLQVMSEDCASFQHRWRDVYWSEPDRICSDGRWTSDEQAGHDFWLTRNGHGTGFWEAGRWSDGIGDQLSTAAKAYGQYDLYVGDDGQISGS